MADRYGDAPIDVPVSADGAAVSDPLLDTLLSFFAAVLNSHASAAWSGVTKKTGAVVVRKTYAHDPARAAFNMNETPSLFLWRESVQRARQIAADWRVRPSKLVLRWVPTATYTQDIKRRWEPFFNAIPSVLDAAVEFGRDPSWVVQGDTDPRAATHGSYLWKYANVHKLEIGREDVTRSLFQIPVEGDREPIAIDALDVPIDLEERLERDSDRYVELADVRTTITRGQ